MKLNHFLIFLNGVLLLGACHTQQKAAESPSANTKKITVKYPATRKDDTVTDDYFRRKISDPYRWLEDDQSAETKAWVVEQNKVTNSYLSQIPDREKFKKRLSTLFNYERYTPPFKEGGKYYYFKNDGLQNQSILYSQEKLDGPATPVLDPNKFSADGTTSLGEMDFSRDGRYLAYSTSKGGSDWRTIVVKDMKTGEMLPDVIEWVKFSGISWKGNGFYYTRYPEPRKGDELKAANKFGAVYYHALGTPQSADLLVYDDKSSPDRSFGGATTEDERFLIINGWESTSGNMLAVKDLSMRSDIFVTISGTFDKDFSVVDNIGDQLLILTNHNAPNQRLILVDPAKPAEKDWKTLIAEDENDVLQSVSVCGGKILCTYLHNAASSLRAYDLSGKLIREVALPEIGSVSGVSGKSGDSQAFFSFTSFLRPSTVYSLDMNTLNITVFKAPALDFNPELYTTEQVWYNSKDGTRVPMFITHRRDMRLDGSNPTLLYGYGGFNISLTPSFSASRAALLENNGVYAVANIRGGGEFGEKWHRAGTKCQKQNVFDDFISAAEFLIAQKYTSSSRLAIQGGSNGGLLVGACMTQRPDLYRVCFPQVGVLDMLRYHQFTIGYAWATDYGRSDVPEEFNCLIKYSPLHNVKEVSYPATMVTTADHDDRVVPAHSFKFAATLQEKHQGSNPVLIRIETSAGHGAGKPTAKIIEEASDILAFMFYNMK